MTHIPKKVLLDILSDPEYAICMLYGFPGHVCHGRITFDHALINSGRQVQMKRAIVALCAKGHSVDEFQDRGDHKPEVSRWIALNRLTNDELKSLSKVVSYGNERERLNVKYGVWEQRYPDYWIPTL